MLLSHAKSVWEKNERFFSGPQVIDSIKYTNTDHALIEQTILNLLEHNPDSPVLSTQGTLENIAYHMGMRSEVVPFVAKNGHLLQKNVGLLKNLTDDQIIEITQGGKNLEVFQKRV